MTPLIDQRSDQQPSGPHEHGPKGPRPFPTASTFFGIAVVFSLFWLLAHGLNQYFGIPQEPASRSTVEAGASK